MGGNVYLTDLEILYLLSALKALASKAKINLASIGIQEATERKLKAKLGRRRR